MFGSFPLLFKSFVFLDLLQEDGVVRLGVLYHGSQYGLVDLGQSGLAGLLVPDGEESFVIFLPPAGLHTPVLQALRRHLEVQQRLGG